MPAVGQALDAGDDIVGLDPAVAHDPPDEVLASMNSCARLPIILNPRIGTTGGTEKHGTRTSYTDFPVLSDGDFEIA